jgi:hypothetical protein
VLIFEYQAQSNASLWSQWPRQNQSIKCIYLLKTVLHFEEQRWNTFSCSLWRKTSDTKPDVHGRDLHSASCFARKDWLPYRLMDQWSNRSEPLHNKLKGYNFQCFEGKLFKEKELLCSVLQTLLFLKLDLTYILFSYTILNRKCSGSGWVH